MESLPKLPILEFTENTLENVRKVHNLHEPGRMDEAIDILSEWAIKQEHFLKKEFPRDYLERLLISTKGSLEKAKVSLDGRCIFRTLAPKHFPMGDLYHIKPVLDGFRFFLLPKFAPDYYRVYLLKGFAKSMVSSDFTAIFQYAMRLAEYWIKYDYFNGFIVVFDFTHEDFNVVDFMTKSNPSEIQQHITANIKYYGARIRGIHIITKSRFADAVFIFLKPFFGAKLANRFHVHKKIDDLFEHVPRDIFPVDYGGKELSIVELHDKWFNVINSEEHIQYMKEVVATGTDESRRLADKMNNEYLGVPGSFRSLKID